MKVGGNTILKECGERGRGGGREVLLLLKVARIR